MDTNGSQQEQQPLLVKAEDITVAKTDGATKPHWRHFLMLPATFCSTFGAMLCYYVLTEWTQFQTTKEYFKNASNNFSTCGSYNISDPGYVKYQDVQKETAKWFMIFSLSELVPVILVQFYLPSLTDSKGRKFLLLLTMFGQCIKSVGITIAMKVSAPFWVIVLILIPSGFTGTYFGLLSASFSFLADLTFTPKHRTTAIVAVEAMLLLAVVIASYLSGYFVETINLGFYYTSLIGTSFSVAALVLFVFTPESLPKHKRSSQQSLFDTVKRMTDFYISSEFKGQRKAYTLLLLSFAMAIVAGMNRGTMETLYFLGEPFCWGPAKIGVFSTVRSAALAIMAFTLPILQLCISDTNIAILSTVSNTTSFVIEAFAKTALIIYMVPVAGMFAFLMTPVIRGLMSSMTPADKQGAMFAGVALIEVIATLIASLSTNSIYTLTMSFMNGFVFLIMAFVSLINMILLCAYKCVTKHSGVYEIVVEEEHVRPKDIQNNA